MKVPVGLHEQLVMNLQRGISAHSHAHTPRTLALAQLKLTGLRFFTVYGPYGRPDMAYFSFTEAILAGEDSYAHARARTSAGRRSIDAGPSIRQVYISSLTSDLL